MFTRFNPDLNPYVSKIEEHRDIIKTIPVESNAEFFGFINASDHLIVDLGCGAGNFLRDYALVKPDASFVGFELRYKRLVKGAVKLKKRHITNVRLVQARAEDIALWLPGDCAHEIYVNFPDPWPKKKQRKHRLLSLGFLKMVRHVLLEGGSFIFKTDHREYFEYAVDLISGCPFFEVMAYSEDLHQSEFNESNIMTEFESLFKAKGSPVHYIKTSTR